MSLNDIPAPDSRTIEDLKAQLDVFVEQSAVTNFDSDDIIELIEEGEAVGWIVDQMKGNRTNIDADGITALLSEIAALIRPPERAAFPDEENEAFEPAAEQAEQPPAPLDFSSLDPDRIDLDELVKSLPPGMKLPPGMGLKQLKDLIESPQAKMMSDFLLFCREKGVDINEGTMNDPRTRDLEIEWKSTPREAFGGKRPDEMLEEHPELMPAQVKTFRREEPRVGRNDPCPCGSGKKHKKCCGKA